MGKYNERISKSIFILVDDEERIHFCNIGNKKMIKEFVEEMNIFEYIGKSSFVETKVGEYVIYIEKINLEGKFYWVITIESEASSWIYKDFSTGLFNRNYWEYIKDKLIKFREDLSYTIIVIDIDNLKEINDQYGHIQGDKAIKIVGHAIKETIRQDDIAIHYGGDEYFIILPSTDEKEAKKIIKRIRKRIDEKCKNKENKIEFSAGIACSDCLYDLEEVAQIADKNMYFEKREKKKRYAKV